MTAVVALAPSGLLLLLPSARTACACWGGEGERRRRTANTFSSSDARRRKVNEGEADKWLGLPLLLLLPCTEGCCCCCCWGCSDVVAGVKVAWEVASLSAAEGHRTTDGEQQGKKT